MPRKKIAPIGDVLGTARRAGNYEAKSEEWHELRRGAIGGSEVAAVVGCSPWVSPFALWAQKTGKVERPVLTSDAVEWGTRLEAVIADKFAENHADFTLYRETGTWVNEERPWQLANTDGLYQKPDGSWGVLEVKTASYEDDWKTRDGWTVPVYYRTQIQWYMQTFGFTEAYVAVLFAGRKYVEILVEADEFEQATNLQLAERFRAHVLEDRQPEFDGADSTLEAVKKMHPAIDDTLDPVELGQLGVYYFVALQEFEAAQSKLNEMKTRVLAEMKTAKRGLVDDQWVLSRQSRNGGTPYLVTKKG